MSVVDSSPTDSSAPVAVRVGASPVPYRISTRSGSTVVGPSSAFGLSICPVRRFGSWPPIRYRFAFHFAYFASFGSQSEPSGACAQADRSAIPSATLPARSRPSEPSTPGSVKLTESTRCSIQVMWAARLSEDMGYNHAMGTNRVGVDVRDQCAWPGGIPGVRVECDPSRARGGSNADCRVLLDLGRDLPCGTGDQSTYRAIWGGDEGSGAAAPFLASSRKPRAIALPTSTRPASDCCPDAANPAAADLTDVPAPARVSPPAASILRDKPYRASSPM